MSQIDAQVERTKDRLKNKLTEIGFRLMGEGSTDRIELEQELLNIEIAVIQAKQCLGVQRTPPHYQAPNTQAVGNQLKVVASRGLRA